MMARCPSRTPTAPRPPSPAAGECYAIAPHLALGGPNPLAGPPPLSSDVRGLFDAVTDEQNLIWIYKRTMASYSAEAPALSALLAEHQAHLAQLRAMIVEPPGKTIPSTVTRKPAVPGTAASAIAQLRAAEQSATTAQLRRLARD